MRRKRPFVRNNLFEIATNALAYGREAASEDTAVRLRYGYEDLLTDMFAALLGLDQELAQSWFRVLTGIRPSSVVSTTQESYPEIARQPDMRLEAPEMVVICEHKVDVDLDEGQLEDYLKLAILRTSGDVPWRVALVGKRGRRPSIPDAAVAASGEVYLRPRGPIDYYTWEDLHEMVENLILSNPNDQSAIGQLRRQFAQHLAHSGFAPSPLMKQGEFTAALAQEDKTAWQLAFAAAEEWFRSGTAPDFVNGPSFKTGSGGRFQQELFIQPMDGSQIRRESGLEWIRILAKSTRPAELERLDDLTPPVLETNFNCNAEHLADSIERIAHASSLKLYVSRDNWGGLGKPRLTVWAELKEILGDARTAEVCGQRILTFLSCLYQNVLLPAANPG